MIGGSSSEIALEAVLQDPDLDVRLLRCRKTIAAVESNELKGTHRLCGALRRVLNSVADDPKASPAQKESSADLYNRVRKFDPRRQAAAIKRNEIDDPALLDACDSDRPVEVSTAENEWDDTSGTATSEWLRLVDIERRPVGNPKDLIVEAIDGRPFTVETLLRLYKYLSRRLPGQLCSEVETVLRSQNALPKEAETPRHNFLEEIEARK